MAIVQDDQPEADCFNFVETKNRFLQAGSELAQNELLGPLGFGFSFTIHTDKE